MLKLTILSPERRLVQDASVNEVTLNTSDGDVQVLPGHAPMVGSLGVGPFHYQSADSSVTSGAILGGFFEVRDDRVVVMAEAVELKGEIDVEGARRAQKEAEDALKDANLEEHHFKEYQARLETAIVQQHVASREH